MIAFETDYRSVSSKGLDEEFDSEMRRLKAWQEAQAAKKAAEDVRRQEADEEVRCPAGC